MHIKYLGDDHFEIKTGSALINLSSRPSVDGFTLPGPGEYEKAGVGIAGIADGLENTIYVFRAEEINLCYLGRMKDSPAAGEIKEIGNVDILFLPLGEEGTLPTKKALDLVSKIDPRVVIPMLYSDITDFKKGEGVEDGEVDSLKIKRVDLPEEERRVVILRSR